MGVSQYYRIDDMTIFHNDTDMEIILTNPDFQDDFYADYGVCFTPEAYYPPANIALDNFNGVLFVLDQKYHFEISGGQYTEDNNYLSVVWVVYDVSDAPGADEIAKFYADLNNLTVDSATAQEGYPIYYFTAKRGGAFFEKFAIKTNYPANGIYLEPIRSAGCHHSARRTSRRKS